jgi:uncharacterized protein DUF397
LPSADEAREAIEAGLRSRSNPVRGGRRSRGSNGGACVEVADNLPGIVAVRDSKDRSGAVLTFTPAQWGAFTAGVRDDELELS